MINAGIPGYTTYQELEFLNLYSLDMQPDVVVLGFVFKDVYYRYLHKPTRDNILGSEPEVHLHHFNVHTFPGILFSRSYLVHKVMHSLKKIPSILGFSTRYSFEHRTDFYLAWKNYGWTETEMLIGKMHQQLSDRGIPLVIVIFRSVPKLMMNT